MVHAYAYKFETVRCLTSLYQVYGTLAARPFLCRTSNATVPIVFKDHTLWSRTLSLPEIKQLLSACSEHWSTRDENTARLVRGQYKDEARG